MGRFDGDNMVCGYHGVAFGPSRRRTRMPAQETLNPSAAVTAHCHRANSSFGQP
ncbi:hypothetical protein [Streptomyces sp. NPDC050759]|uniref:hypothetical protein n=1 Tax=Streptomyces sp. NPDC050759 TaxID=3365635 RepID=UPI0037885332